MLDTKTAYDANIYTDFQGLDSLHYRNKTHPDDVKKEVSKQFESLLVQMLLKSMRDTNKEFSSDLMKSEQSGFYEDLYDKQLAMVLANSGMGIAKTIENYLDRKPGVVQPAQVNDASVAYALHVDQAKETIEPIDLPAVAPQMAMGLSGLDTRSSSEPAASFETTDDFVKTLWSSAKEAAHLLGVDPKILLAQAALETNWGKNIIPHEDGGSTNNLFNIKADKSWSDKSASFNTIEQKDNVLVKEKAKFRAYNSYLDSFVDYAAFLKQNSRYTEALQNASDPRKFVQSLQHANYATDTLYSEKVMDIFSSRKFNDLFEHLS